MPYKLKFKYIKKDARVEITDAQGHVFPEGVEMPKEVADVLDAHGFTYTQLSGVYMDCFEPTGDDFYEEFCHIAHHVPVYLYGGKKRLRRKTRPLFEVRFEGVEMPSQGSDLHETFGKAYEAWHKGGRPVSGRYFKEALKDAVEEVNVKLREKKDSIK